MAERKKRTYTEKQKKEAVKALGLNGCDTGKTSREIGVSVASLNRWAEQYPELLGKGQEGLTAQIVKKGDLLQEDFLEKAMRCKDLAIERIKELVPKEKSINTLLSVVETLNNVTEGKSGTSVDVGSLFLQINNQISE